MTARPDATQRGYNQKWRRTRGRYLKHHPVCELPMCDVRATDVHHLDNLGPFGPDGHRWHNLQALCHSHHSQITASRAPRHRQLERHPGST